MINKNNLNSSLSAYLRQHKDNPVNWQEWSKETLAFAKEKKMPILLSVGYASCHWCHVMAHESFEDKETSEMMNRKFINIKVDREERPDIDFVFQSSFQLFNQAGGGWPLTMFLDENGVPFSGGTYFPKTSQHGLPSFKNVLQKVSDIYVEQREKIISQRNLIIKNLTLRKSSVINQDPKIFTDDILNKLDNIKGGFKGAPKFPTFYVFDALLYFYNKYKDEKYLKPVELLLNKICSQGIYDHVESGISRYTVDENWLVPHFEKMLYDNIQFISLISKFLKIKKNDYLKKKMLDTINFLKSGFLNSECNLLGSAYDADSEGVEGKYYTFEYNELKHIEKIENYFEISPDGNWEGKIILKEIKPISPNIRDELMKIRKKRTKPFFDNKTQLDLNCFWVSALLNSYSISKDKNILITCEKFFKNIQNKFEKKILFHCHSEKDVFLEDYAYYIQMLLDLYDNTMNVSYKFKADERCNQAIELFFDEKKNIFHKNLIKENDLFLNPIDISDSTIPNGNSIMLLNLTRLGKMEIAKKLSESLIAYTNFYGGFMTSSIKSIDFFKEISSGKNCDSEGCSV